MIKFRSEEKNISFEKAVETFLEEERPHIELSRRRRVEEVAAVITLCSQQFSYIAGSNYRVDGGSIATIGTMVYCSISDSQTFSSQRKIIPIVYK